VRGNWISATRLGASVAGNRSSTHVPEGRNKHCTLGNGVLFVDRERFLSHIRDHDYRRAVTKDLFSHGVRVGHLIE